MRTTQLCRAIWLLKPCVSLSTDGISVRKRALFLYPKTFIPETGERRKHERKNKTAGREAVNAALKQLMSEGVEVNTGEGTEGEEEISLAEKVREAYEGSIEYRLGCQIMDGLTQGYALTSDDAEAMLTGEYAPKSSEIVGARAAETLKRMEKEGRLARGIESYLADGEFLQMLRQMPAELAIRIKEAEWAAEGAKNARDAIEKLKARQALPTPMRTIIPVSAEPDFSTMSSEEFARFKRRRFGQ